VTNPRDELGRPARTVGTKGAPADALTFRVPAELIEVIAERAAELLVERQTEPPKDDWLRGADRIGAYIDAPASRVYSLVSVGRIPIHRDGSALIAQCCELDAWVRDGGGKRP
jgi:hypothetical protein